MSKVQHALQLLHSGNPSTRQIGSALGISKTTGSEIASYIRAAGLYWERAQYLSDEELKSRLYLPPVARQSRHLKPDYAHLHSELKRIGIKPCICWGRRTILNNKAWWLTSTAPSVRSASNLPSFGSALYARR